MVKFYRQILIREKFATPEMKSKVFIIKIFILNNNYVISMKHFKVRCLSK